jgi:hypothetical protein
LCGAGREREVRVSVGGRGQECVRKGGVVSSARWTVAARQAAGGCEARAKTARSKLPTDISFDMYGHHAHVRKMLGIGYESSDEDEPIPVPRTDVSPGNASPGPR